MRRYSLAEGERSPRPARWQGEDEVTRIGSSPYFCRARSTRSTITPDCPR
jgi:hypothetical protein